ncbi:hypothetical protein OCT51_11160 [Halomonas sp. LR3S48]|uniref:hypothetical protein n=1 Tax=Halomonas sp. LR3S48 TaxID=2982694 RepID=UPI0021E40002|nr:hypothetical protein [Halomonas sp. LR3S48]UYG01772.1 hypothetical protein OCT51_11160 [Halomonas sp. LR3S48]
MPSRDVLKRLDALESQEGPSQGPRIIRLILPSPGKEPVGISLYMADQRLYVPDDREAGRDLLLAMYWLIYPEGKRVILAIETDVPPPGSLIIPPCPDDVDLDDYARQQVQRLNLITNHAQEGNS